MSDTGKIEPTEEDKRYVNYLVWNVFREFIPLFDTPQDMEQEIWIVWIKCKRTYIATFGAKFFTYFHQSVNNMCLSALNARNISDLWLSSGDSKSPVVFPARVLGKVFYKLPIVDTDAASAFLGCSRLNGAHSFIELVAGWRIDRADYHRDQAFELLVECVNETASQYVRDNKPAYADMLVRFFNGESPLSIAAVHGMRKQYAHVILKRCHLALFVCLLYRGYISRDRYNRLVSSYRLVRRSAPDKKKVEKVYLAAKAKKLNSSTKRKKESDDGNGN